MAAPFLFSCTPRGKRKSKLETPIPWRDACDKQKGGMYTSCPHMQCACTHILLHSAFLAQSCLQTYVVLASLGLELGRSQQAKVLAQQTSRLFCRMLSNVTWLQPLSLIYHVLLMSFPKVLSFCSEAMRLWQSKLKFHLPGAMAQISV